MNGLVRISWAVTIVFLSGCGPEAIKPVTTRQTTPFVSPPISSDHTSQTQNRFMPKPPVPTQRSTRPQIDLLPHAPHANDGDPQRGEQWEHFFDQTIIRNVSQPSIYPILPQKSASNGKAIIVVPGGGYQFIAVQNEGFPVAQRLADEGYAVFVLKYRTFVSPRGAQDFLSATIKMFETIGKDVLPDHPLAVDDLARAIDFVAANCADYGCQPDEIGVIGFSAGARTAIRLIEGKEQAAGLQNVALLYPPSKNPIVGGPRPPLFMAIAANDPLFLQGGLTMLDQYLTESKNVEFHLFANGDHGFGMQSKATTSMGWIDQYIKWLNLVGTSKK